MAYYITKKSVERHKQLLAQIQTAMSKDEDIILATAPGQSPGAAKYWLRNLFASAKQFPEFGFADLGDNVVVSILDTGQVRVYPIQSASPLSPIVVAVDEFGALAELTTSNRSDVSLSFRPSDEYEEDALIAAAKELGWAVTILPIGDGRLSLGASRHEDVVDNPNPFDAV